MSLHTNTCILVMVAFLQNATIEYSSKSVSFCVCVFICVFVL